MRGRLLVGLLLLIALLAGCRQKPREADPLAVLAQPELSAEYPLRFWFERYRAKDPLWDEALAICRARADWDQAPFHGELGSQLQERQDRLPLRGDTAGALAFDLGLPAAGRRARGAAMRRRLLLRALPLLLMALLVPASATAEALLTEMVRDYQSHSLVWLSRLAPLARNTFALLALLQVALFGLWAIVRGDSLGLFVGRFVKQFIVIGFFYSLLLFYPSFVPVLVKGFEQAGQVASGSTAVDPSAVLDLGIRISTNMSLAFGSLGWLANPTGNITASFTSFFTLVAFIFIAAQLTLTLVEVAVTLPAGIFFLSFAPFRPTAAIAEAYLGKLLELGARLFVLYLVVGIGVELAETWAALDFYESSAFFQEGLRPHFRVLAESVIFALLTWRIPTDFGIVISRGHGFGVAEALAS